jgi:hypothetical protein
MGLYLWTGCWKSWRAPLAGGGVDDGLCLVGGEGVERARRDHTRRRAPGAGYPRTAQPRWRKHRARPSAGDAKEGETSLAATLCVVRRLLIYLWTLPTTCVGLLFLPLALLGGGGMRAVEGVLEIHGGLVRAFLRHCTLLHGGASAMTLGHVVLGQDEHLLDLTRAHERVHVRQAERWGPFFLPAYGIASLVALLRGGSAYRDNYFEREAYGSDMR